MRAFAPARRSRRVPALRLLRPLLGGALALALALALARRRARSRPAHAAARMRYWPPVASSLPSSTMRPRKRCSSWRREGTAARCEAREDMARGLKRVKTRQRGVRRRLRRRPGLLEHPRRWRRPPRPVSPTLGVASRPDSPQARAQAPGLGRCQGGAVWPRHASSGRVTPLALPARCGHSRRCRRRSARTS